MTGVPVVTELEASRLAKLKQAIGSDAPSRVRAMGNLELLDKPAVGFCGSRKASENGLAAASDCAKEVVQNGMVVISGYAAGVDLEAHGAALKNGGETVIVLPEGIDRFRIKKVLKNSWDWSRVLVISQWNDSAVWRSYQAMARNNTIIGCSNSMIVIEAGETGGTRHAGEKTLLHGVPLFVIEFRDYSEERLGNVALLNAGGVPIKRRRSDGKPSLNRLFDAVNSHHLHGPRQAGLI